MSLLDRKPYTKTLFTGNVIEAPDNGGKWIVTHASDTHVQAVAFDYQNVSAGQPLEDHMEKYRCSCGGDSFNYDDDCETCHGTGHYERLVLGWKHAKVLAPNVKEFILLGVKRTWGI